MGVGTSRVAPPRYGPTLVDGQEPLRNQSETPGSRGTAGRAGRLRIENEFRSEHGKGDIHPGGDDGDHAYEFDEDVETGASGVLKWIAHGIADDSGFVRGGPFAPVVAFLDVFFRVVLGTAGVGHKDGQNKAGGQAAAEQAERTRHAVNNTDGDGGGDGDDGR